MIYIFNEHGLVALTEDANNIYHLNINIYIYTHVFLRQSMHIYKILTSESEFSFSHVKHAASWHMAENLLQKKSWPENFQQTSDPKGKIFLIYFEEVFLRMDM